MNILVTIFFFNQKEGNEMQLNLEQVHRLEFCHYGNEVVINVSYFLKLLSFSILFTSIKL